MAKSPVRVWVPYDELLPRMPDGVLADVYDGAGAAPSTVEDVEFYVPPYSFDRTPLKLMADMPRLRVVQLLTKGYEHALPYVPDGVTLCNAGGVHDASTAELAVTLTLAALRGLPDFVRGQDAGQWRHVQHDALADKRVLIVGQGGIGAAIERRLSGFEVSIRRVARTERAGVHPVSALPDLLPDTDVVILAIPLTEQTHHLVDAAFLARLPDGALVVNVARGSIVDTAALVMELESGRLRAALDVTEPEPPPADHPLWKAPGLLLSPHVGGNTTAFRPRADRLVLTQLDRYLAGQHLESQVSS